MLIKGGIILNKKKYLILAVLAIISVLCCLNVCSAVEYNKADVLSDESDNHDWTGVVDGTQVHVKTPQANEDVKIVKKYYKATKYKGIKKTKTYKGYFTTSNDGGMLDLSKTKNVKKHLKTCFNENYKWGMNKNLKKAVKKYYYEGKKLILKVKKIKTNSKNFKDYTLSYKKVTKWKTLSWRTAKELLSKVRKKDTNKYKYSHNTYGNGVTYSHYKYITSKPIKKYYTFKFKTYKYKVIAKVKYTYYKPYKVNKLHYYSIIGSKSGEFARLNINKELYYL